MPKPGKSIIALTISLTLNAVLIVFLIITITMLLSSGSKNALGQNVVAPIEEEIVEEQINIDMFKEYAAQYGIGSEFVQKFFDDAIVYKDEGNIIYSPIDQTLKMNNYDWSKLVRSTDGSGEIKYEHEGVLNGIKWIDVSKYQGNINWKKVKASGVDNAILRVGYRGYETGKILLDETFEKNIENAVKAGVNVGVYFFSQAITTEEAIEEATFVIRNIYNKGVTLPIVFDTEEIGEDSARADKITQQERTDITIAFCEEIKKAGYTPMVYANTKWFVSRLDMSRLAEYDKWLAQYYKTPFFPYDFQVWQYTGKGKIDGIEGDVDLNISFSEYPKAQATSSNTSSANTSSNE